MLRTFLWLILLFGGPAHAGELIVEPQKPLAQALPEGWRHCGGGRLTMKHEDFGGFSGLVWHEGKLLALSDRGHLLTMDVVQEDGELQGLEVIDFQPILDEKGARPERLWRDTEAIIEAQGQLWVAYEQHHRVHTLGADARWGQAGWPHPGQAMLDGNGGTEAMAYRNGQWLLLSETIMNGQLLAWRGSPEKGWEQLTYPDGGYEPTAMAMLSDGSLLVVERRFSIFDGFTSRLMRLSADVWEGAPLKPEKLADLTALMLDDNVEGLAVRPLKDGGYQLLFTTDDNFNRWQRTYLMAF